MVLAGALTLAMATGAQATPTGLFGNTLNILTAEGVSIVIYVNADGSYTGVLNDTAPLGGSWVETGGQMCMTQTIPFAAPVNCGPTIAQSVGASWSVARPDGQSNQFTIVAGRP